MISYYKYWQAKGRYNESLKTVEAMKPDVPPMVEAQNEMDALIVEYWKEKTSKFTTKLLTVVVFCVTLGILHFHYRIF